MGVILESKSRMIYMFTNMLINLMIYIFPIRYIQKNMQKYHIFVWQQSSDAYISTNFYKPWNRRLQLASERCVCQSSLFKSALLMSLLAFTKMYQACSPYHFLYEGWTFYSQMTKIHWIYLSRIKRMYRLSYLKNHLPQPGRRLFPYLSKARTRTMHQLLLHHTLNPCVKKWELFLFQKKEIENKCAA